MSQIKTSNQSTGEALCWDLLVLHRHVNNRYLPRRVCIVEVECAPTRVNTLVSNLAAVAGGTNAACAIVGAIRLLS